LIPGTLDIATWQIPTPREQIARLDTLKARLASRGEKPQSSLRTYTGIFSNLISPLDFYCYLKARFGEPNGFQNQLKKPFDTDNLIHWHFSLKSGTAFIDIMGHLASVHIIIESDLPIGRDHWISFVQNLKASYGSVGTKKGITFKALEKWKLFINPYARLNNIVNHLYSELKRASDRTFPR
jgi:hypothetical protein